MHRSLAVCLFVALTGVALAQDLQFTRTWSRTEAIQTVMSTSAPTGADGGYVLFKVGEQASEISRYNVDGEIVASQFVDPPFGGQPVSAAVAVDATGNTFLAYSSPGLGFNQVVLERYSPAMVRLGRVFPPSNGASASAIQLRTDGTNAYLAYQEGPDGYAGAFSSSLANQWSRSVNSISSLNCIAVGNNRVLVGMGSGNSPFLAGYDQTTGDQVFFAFLNNGGGTAGVNRVSRIEFSPDGQAYLLNQIGDTQSQLVEYGLQDDIIYGPIRAGTSPTLLALAGTTKLFWGGNTSSGWAVLKSDQGNMEVEAVCTEPTTARLRTAKVDVSTGLVWILGSDETVFQRGYTQVLDIPTLNIQTGRDVPGPTFSDLILLRPGRFLASGGAGVAFHQGLIRPQTPSLWKVSEYPVLPIRHVTQGTVVDAANNAYVLDQSPTRVRLLKYDAAGVLKWVQSVYQVDTVNSDMKSILSMGPDGRPVVTYSANRSTFVAKFNADGSRAFEQFVVAFSVIDVAVGVDNKIYALFASGSGVPFIYYLDGATGAILRSLAEVNLSAGRRIAVTPTGYVVVSGSVVGASSWVVRNPAGNTHWTFIDSGANKADDEDMAMQANGLAAIAFRQRNNSTMNYRFRAFRIDPIRKLVMMTSTLAGTATEPSFDVATSAAGTIYLAQAGASKGLIQYNTSGAVAWVKSLPSGVSKVVQCVTDVQNSVYVLAEETYPVPQGGTATGWYFVKYNTLGTLLTQRRYQGATGFDGTPSALVIGRVFDIWVAGNMQIAGQGVANVVQRYLQPVPPTVVGDSYQISEGMTFSDNVLTNDSDLNGDALTAQLVSNPSGGTLTLAADGSFTYTAPTNFLGTISFKYRAVDSTGRSTIGQCNFEVIP